MKKIKCKNGFKSMMWNNYRGIIKTESGKPITYREWDVNAKIPGRGRDDERKATDIASWAEGQRPYKTESGKDYAKPIMDEKYGAGNYDTGAGSEYNKLKKYGDRGFE